MKKIILLLIINYQLSIINCLAQNVGIGTTTPNSSAQLDVQSTTKGMLIPRMTSSQRNLIPLPAIGLLVYDNTTGSFWFRNGFRWLELVDSSNTIWTKDGSNVYVNNGENVGIGTSTPDLRLHVNNGTDITSGIGGYLQLGSTGLQNLALDNNEIQARNNGISSNLILQNGGGDVRIGNSTNSNADLNIANGKLTKPPTGVFNMMPLCYGKIAANGTIISTTPNVTITKDAAIGVYLVNCTGINNSTTLIGTVGGFIGNTILVSYSAPGQAEVIVYNTTTASGVNTAFSFFFYNQ